MGELLDSHAGLSDEKRQELLKAIRDAGKPEALEEDFKRLFADKSIVVSARDVKELTPDFSRETGHAKEHGWARYTLPVTESQLKAQDWEGRAEQEQKKKEAQEQKEKEKQEKEGTSAKDATADKSDDGKKPEQQNDRSQTSQKGDTDKTGGESATDQKKNREQDSGAEHGDSTEQMSDEERRFMDNLIEEANTVAGFKNCTGEPGPAEEDYTSEDQVGAAIQTDDQFTPDVRTLPAKCAQPLS